MLIMHNSKGRSYQAAAFAVVRVRYQNSGLARTVRGGMPGGGLLTGYPR